MWVKRAVVAVTLTVFGVGSSTGVAAADPVPPPPPTPNPAASTPVPGPAAPAPLAGKTTIDADGIYAVGVDIAPGIYTSAGPVQDGTCSWRRLGNPDGATIDRAFSHQPQVVQIDATDKDFRTRGCQPWTLSPDAAPPAPGIAPMLAGLQLKMYMAQLNGKAAASGQLPPP